MTYRFTLEKPKQSSGWIPALILVAVGVVFWCGLAYWLPQWFNNQRLQKFAYNLYNYPLPPETEVVSQYAKVGLMGNGNHCDFVVTQSLTSALDRTEIEAYYRTVALPAVDVGSMHGDKVPLGLTFSEATFPDGELFFTLSLIDVDYPPGFDIRCH